jgi:hypothetical protein
LRKLGGIALAAAAAAVAGGAIAAGSKSHVMNVALPDGSVARIEYVGDVAPKVTVAPPKVAAGAWAVPAFPSLGDLDRMVADLNRQRAAIIRQAQQLARQSAPATGSAANLAAYGDVPGGSVSTTVVSVRNGNTSCTRTTQIVGQGPGKPPKVVENASGNCTGLAAPAPRVPTPPPPPPLDRT